MSFHEPTPWIDILLGDPPLLVPIVAFVWTLFGFLFGFVTVMYAPESENPNGCAYWFFLGFILGPVGILIAIIADKLKK